MEPTKELADELFRDKVRQARATRPDERMLDGAGCSIRFAAT